MIVSESPFLYDDTRTTLTTRYCLKTVDLIALDWNKSTYYNSQENVNYRLDLNGLKYTKLGLFNSFIVPCQQELAINEYLIDWND